MNNAPPLNEQPITDKGIFSQGWASWFSLAYRLLTWKRSFVVTTTLDFSSIAAQSQLSLSVTPVPALGLTGVRSGDAVQVTPTTDVSGVIFTGVVTANDTVTVYAKNFTASAIDPVSQVYRIIVLQN